MWWMFTGAIHIRSNVEIIQIYIIWRMGKQNMVYINNVLLFRHRNEPGIDNTKKKMNLMVIIHATVCMKTLC